MALDSGTPEDGIGASPRPVEVCNRFEERDRAWLDESVRKVEADTTRSADTHLFTIPLPSDWGIDLYMKDESTHPTGSLKHRLARSLFLYALCSGQIREGTKIIEASSGSTAVSEAYFARMLGLPFVAVIPIGTSPEKVQLIEFYGGTCHFVPEARQVRDESRQLAKEAGGMFMDQFTYAERATDWRSSNNIAESIFLQMAQERYPVPQWVVVGAGTGGTSATIGRYIRYRRHHTRLCVVDPENSAFFDGWCQQNAGLVTRTGSRIEGIGRPQVEPSFIPTVVDRMMRIPDAASIAAMRYLETIIGRRAGGSTGTNLWAALHIIAEMRARNEHGSVVTLLCDGGERYCGTYYDDTWLRAHGIDIAPYAAVLDHFQRTGQWDAPAQTQAGVAARTASPPTY